MKKAIFFFFTLVVYSPFASAQKEGMAAINKNDIKAYMTFLASDELEGRETGTQANDISALFIKENLMRLGVKPASSLDDYFQKIPLYSTRIKRDDSSIKIYGNQGEIVYSTDSVVVMSPSSKTIESSGNVVFAGYGFQDAASGYDDFSGISLKDKIVLIMIRKSCISA